MDNLQIKQIRINSGMSQAEFADKFKIKLHSLQNWEQGLRQPPECIPYMINEILKMEQQTKKERAWHNHAPSEIKE